MVRYNHNNSFKNDKENGTKLAKYVGHLQNSKINYNIKWNILHHIGEKTEIANPKKNINLNKR